MQNLQAWWDEKMKQQEKAISEARLPESMEDVSSTAELIKFTRSLPEDSPLFIRKQENLESSTTEPVTNSPNST